MVFASFASESNEMFGLHIIRVKKKRARFSIFTTVHPRATQCKGFFFNMPHLFRTKAIMSLHNVLFRVTFISFTRFTKGPAFLPPYKLVG